MSSGAATCLRVVQLDAAELDDDIEDVCVSQATAVVDAAGFSGESLAPELSTALRSLLWWFSMRSDDATLGQQMLDVNYVAARKGELSALQKCAHFASVVVLPWLCARRSELFAAAGDTSLYQFVAARLPPRVAEMGRRFVATPSDALVVDACVELVSLGHFLWFLNRGGCRSVLERVLGLRAVYASGEPPPLDASAPNLHAMNLELIWHGMFDFIIFMMPLWSFARDMARWAQRRLRRRLLGAPTAAATVEVDDWLRCVRCGEPPVLPHSIGCRHVMCYYCVQSSMMRGGEALVAAVSNGAVECPECGDVREGSIPVFLGRVSA